MLRCKRFDSRHSLQTSASVRGEEKKKGRAVELPGSQFYL